MLAEDCRIVKVDATSVNQQTNAKQQNKLGTKPKGVEWTSNVRQQVNAMSTKEQANAKY